ncbi:hypothetical protein D3C84_1148280 [compost metagenome]
MADCRDQGQVDQVLRIVRRAADDAHDLVTLRLQLGEVVVRRQRFALLPGPGRQEKLLEFGDHRPFDADVRVAPAGARVTFSLGMPARW